MASPTFRIRGIAPPDLPRDPAIRRLFWGWVVELGLARKDRELAQGLDKNGDPLRPISARTREHRRSAMTPDGRGDPSAPPLMPARQLSRTRSLLAGRAAEDAAIFYWRFDAFSGRSWGDVLAVHRRAGRDVIGLSPKGTARVRALAWERWRRWKAGTLAATPATTRSPSPGIPKVGSYSTAHATFGIGVRGPEKFGAGEWTGGMTWPEWRRYFRRASPTPVAIPGRPAAAYPRILAHVWGTRTPGPGHGAVGTTPTAPRPAGPSPAKVPLPAAKPAAAAFDWSKAVDTSSRPYRDQADYLRDKRDRFWIRAAMSANMDDAELRAKFDAGLKAVVDAAEPYLRVKPRVLGRILEGGRFKTQFETGTSGGALDPAARRQVEATVMGVPEAAPAEARPIYGYLGERGFGGFGKATERAPRTYGTVSIRLKRSVLGRSTVTIGDSLSRGDQLQASKALAPSSISLPVGGSFEHTAAAAAGRLVGSPGKTADNLRFLQREFHYVEVQYFGGLPVEDIADVAFEARPTPEMIRQLQDKGIPWRVIKPAP
jgi:hypothetical protein